MAPFDEPRSAISASSPGVPRSEAGAVRTAEPPGAANAIQLPSAAPPARRLVPAAGTAPGALGWLLMAGIVILGFLLASFPARNADLWMHLARGKQIAAGELSTAVAVEHPSWLFDLLSYTVYTAFGGTGLVVFKALLVAAVAVVLIRLSAVGGGWWLPISCTALALLLMGVRLGLRPTTLSYLFLALTSWCLRPRQKQAAAGSLWPLLVLFTVWTVADGWFVLGLAVVALVELGRLLDRWITKAGSDGNGASVAVALVCAALAAAWVLNPLHLSAMGLPSELAWLGPDAATQQMTWRRYFAAQGWTPAGLAYFVLAASGLASFLLTLPDLRWERFLPWVGLAGLSAVEVNTVPFFAVVAGPVLAWNLHDILARRVRDTGPSLGLKRSVALGRGATALLTVVLLVSAWPGWLQSGQLQPSGGAGDSQRPPYEPRRWAVETQASLESGAKATRQWIKQGKLAADGRGLHFAAETVDAYSWFCPEERPLRDSELAKAVIRARGAPADWAERMRKARVDHVVLYDSDLDRLSVAMGRLFEDPQQWPLLFVEGSVAVFGWRDPGAGAPDRFREQLDVNRLAFRPPPDQKAPSIHSQEILEGRGWFDAFWKPVPPRSKEQEEARLYLSRADALRRGAPARHQEAWEKLQAVALVGAAGGWSGPKDVFDAYLRIARVRPKNLEGTQFALPPFADVLGHALLQQYGMLRDDTPPAMLYLAIRAARQAIAKDPDDAQAYLVLGDSYLRLLHATREKVWTQQFPELLQLRRAQAGAALNKAVTLKPDFAEAHLSLASLYRDLEYLDLMLKHQRAYFDLARENGPPRGTSPDQFAEQEKDFEDELKLLARDVEKRESAYEVASTGRPVLDRATLATRQGLAAKALEMLLDSDISAFGARGMALEVELLLRTGQPEKVRDWTGPENQAAVDARNYYWRRLQALAACGDYEGARKSCEDLARTFAPPLNPKIPLELRQWMAVTISQRVLSEYAGGNSLPDLVRQVIERTDFLNFVAEGSQSLTKEADVKVLRGLLALEEGDVREAEVAFREALSYWKDARTAASGGGLEFKSRVVAQTCLEWLEQAATPK